MRPPACTLEPLSETRITRIGHGPDKHGRMEVVLLTENPRLTISMKPQAARGMCECILELLNLPAFVRERN